MKNRAVLIFVMFAVVFCGVSFAGRRTPGKYSGLVVYDRWDGCTLYSGISVMYISEKVKEQLRSYAGKAVEINATEVQQIMNPGDGLIKQLEYIGPAKGKQPYGVALEGLELKSMIACKDGEKPAVEMEIINKGKETVKIQGDELALTLLMKHNDKSKFFSSPSDGPSVALITRVSFWVGSNPSGESRWQNKAISHATEYQWTIGKENALPHTFELKAGEKKSVKITFGLGEGEYEFLCGYGGGVHAAKCLASGLVGFDVDAKGLAKNVRAKKQGNSAPIKDLGWYGEDSMPVPDGAKIILTLDKDEYFLGENVLVHFELENTGHRPFKYSFGGDSRGASRALRFIVTATDQDGEQTEDPNPNQMCGGGLCGTKELKPGEKFTKSLPLMRYCDIVKPGIYTIRVTHDLGWKEGDKKRPVGETMVVFKMPNAEQAKQIVEDMMKLSKDPNNSWGKRGNPYLDFGCLRYPVYLDILTDLVRNGDLRALEGIGKMPTVKATETLIELADELQGKGLLTAVKSLNMRIPYPQPHLLYYTDDGQLTVRGRLVKRSWDEKLAPKVRALAAKLLKSEDVEIVAAGAFMIRSVGKKED